MEGYDLAQIARKYVPLADFLLGPPIRIAVCTKVEDLPRRIAKSCRLLNKARCLMHLVLVYRVLPSSNRSYLFFS